MSLLAKALGTTDEEIVAFYKRVGIYDPLNRLAHALNKLLSRF